MTAPRLLQLTDLHLFARPRGRLRGVATRDSLAAVLARARRYAWPPDAILLTGDLIHDGSAAGYAYLRAVFADLGVPVLCLAGNHDDPQLMRSTLCAPPFQCGGMATFGNWRVLLLETHLPGQDGGALSDASLELLQSCLRAESRLHLLVGLHHHPVAVGSAWLDEIGVANREALFAAIAGHDHVRALLWGHVHQTYDEQIGGLRLLATPSTCVQFKPRSRRFRYDTRPPACRWLTLHDDGRIATEILWAED